MSRPLLEPCESFGDRHGGARRCERPDCAGEGLYRAPVSPRRLDQYYWFCLEHVREYNKTWDFLKGLSETEIEALRRNDTVWQRPSWPLSGGRHATEEVLRRKLAALFGDAAAETTPRRRPLTGEEKALAELELAPTASFDEVKLCYKRLAKRLHPDANGGDKAAEDRLKIINQAYAVLKASFLREGSSRHGEGPA